MPQTIVVRGARNLGGAIVDYFLGLGWNAAAVARSEETPGAGALGTVAFAILASLRPVCMVCDRLPERAE
jgi:hypothetical protein